MRNIFALCILVLLGSSLLAQKKPFTIADYYSIKDISDPQFSPDGKRIAFVVTESVLEKGKANSDIYVIDTEGKDFRRLTNNPARDVHPRWSKDGKSILFVSNRKDGPQAWLLPVDGGEPTQLTTISTGVSDPLWMPDGKNIIFSSGVYPECGADNAANKKIADAVSNGPVKAHMADHLLYRHWTSWKDGTRTHTFLYTIDSKTTTDLTPGDFDAPAFSLDGGSGYAVSPDGKEICFSSNHDLDEAESTNTDLFIVPAGGSESVNITKSNQSFDGNPVFSPDGRYIAYKTQIIPRYESDRIRLALYDRKTGMRTILTDALDNWVNEFYWTPDSRTIYFTAEVKGHVPLYSVDIISQRITPVADLKTIDAFTISPDGRWIVAARRAVGEPVELWRMNSHGERIQRLTYFNKPVEDSVDIRPVEELWIPSPSGKKIHTFIVKPHDFDSTKKYPLILNVHGGPQQQWADAFRGDWQVYPGAGYIVAFPNPHGSRGYGQEFTAAISKDWGGKVFDDITAVTDSLAKLTYVDSDRMGAMGWSYGGYMMMWLEGHTDRFKAIVSMMGVYNLTAMYGATEELWFPEWDLGGTPWESDLYQKWSPNNFVKNFKTPCLVITGELDYRVPYTQSLEFFTDLQKMNVPSRLIVFPNDGHWPSKVKSMPLYYNAHLDWFHKYLGGDPAPYNMEQMIRNQIFDIK
jgi:dipeptidyl aminopeptidase/acylaminoacyl peptidase